MGALRVETFGCWKSYQVERKLIAFQNRINDELSRPKTAGRTYTCASASLMTPATVLVYFARRQHKRIDLNRVDNNFQFYNNVIFETL